MNARRSLAILMVEALFGGEFLHQGAGTFRIVRNAMPEIPYFNKLYYASQNAPYGRNVFFAIANRRKKRKGRKQ